MLIYFIQLKSFSNSASISIINFYHINLIKTKNKAKEANFKQNTMNK